MNLFFYPDSPEILKTWNWNSSFKYFRVIRIEKQIRPFVFWGSYGSTILFRDILTFSICSDIKYSASLVEFGFQFYSWHTEVSGANLWQRFIIKVPLKKMFLKIFYTRPFWWFLAINNNWIIILLFPKYSKKNLFDINNQQKTFLM